MARNGSGTMSVSNSFTDGTTILSTPMNANFTDFAAETTNSMAVDGQSTATGQMKGANGTVGAPAWTFGSDLDCGWYRIGANNIGGAVNGTKILDIATTGLTVTGVVAATTMTVGGAAPYTVGGTDVAITDGGTGASTAANAFAALKQDATETATGVVELATTAEADTGTDTTRAITAAGLKSHVDARLASQAQMEAATATTVYVAPGRAHFHPGTAKATAQVNGAGTAINYDYGVASITDNGAGDLTLTTDTAFSATTAMVPHVSIFDTDSGSTNRGNKIIALTTTTVRVLSEGSSGSNGDPADSWMVTIHGDH